MPIQKLTAETLEVAKQAGLYLLQEFKTFSQKDINEKYKNLKFL